MLKKLTTMKKAVAAVLGGATIDPLWRLTTSETVTGLLTPENLAVAAQYIPPNLLGYAAAAAFVLRLLHNNEKELKNLRSRLGLED